MNGTPTLLLVFGGLVLLGLGAAIGYVLVRSKASPETWAQLVLIADRARQIFGNVFTAAEIAAIAEDLYVGLKLETATNYTLEEFTAMLLRILPVDNAEQARSAISTYQEPQFAFAGAQMQSDINAILIDTKRKIEAGTA